MEASEPDLIRSAFKIMVVLTAVWRTDCRGQEWNQKGWRISRPLAVKYDGKVAQMGRLWLRRGKRVAFEAVFVIELSGLVDELDIG